MTTTLDTRFEQSVVCVVDGDPAVRDGLTYLCRSSGHGAAGFATGFAFLRALDQLPTRCVICDAELPDRSGVSLFAELRRRGNSAPFALLLDRPDEVAAVEAERMGIQLVLAKPLTQRHVLAEFLRG